MPTHETLIRHAYKNFNSRNIDEVFTTMHPDVDWPNGWEGGFVKGFDEIRDYWTRQWREIDPIVEPVHLKPLDENTVEVEVHQVVKDFNGDVLFDGYLKHIYAFENGLIRRMEIVQ